MIKKIGVIIGRMNPLHLGHIKLIQTSLQNNDITIVILWSDGLYNENNPLTTQQRKDCIEFEFNSPNNLQIQAIVDTVTDKQWVELIAKQIPTTQTLTFYGGDFKNDSAIHAVKNYIDLLNTTDVRFIEIPRANLEISATEVRELIKNGNTKKALTKMWKLSGNMILKMI